MSTETTTNTTTPVVEQGNAQATPPLAPATETKAPEPKEAQRFAALAKREAALVKRDRELKAQIESDRAQLAKERAEFEAWKSQKAEEDALWQSDPVEGLKRRGYDYDKLTQHVLNQGKPTPDKIATRVVREELEAFRREQAEKAKEQQEAADKAAREREQKTFEETLAQFHDDVTKFCQTEGDKYELINLYGKPAVDIVLATIEKHFQETSKAGQPKILSKEEAADLVEKYLEGEAQRISQAKKLTAKATPQPTQEETSQSKEAPLRTLNNNLTPTTTPASPTYITREERLKRALAVDISR
jgi:hypothetical protein